MILAHLSDLHLGFRAYGRVERGQDMRERDVAAAWERAVERLVRLEPGLIVVSGDVFDRPDPPASAVVALARGLESLRQALPDTPVLLVSGPRDTPRRAGDPGALTVLDTFPNVEAATGLTRSLIVDRLELHACLVPYRALVRPTPAPPEPDPRARWNVLVLHGEAVQGVGRGLYVDPDDWNYVALGGSHRNLELAPNVHSPGSLERVALDPWDEAAVDKGFLTYDLERGEATFHSIPCRPVVALAPVKVRPGVPEQIRRRVREVTDEVPGGIDGKIVRLRLAGAGPKDLLALQGDLLAELRRRALHLTVEAGREVRAPPDAWVPVDAPGLLRDALESELDRDGLLDDETADAIWSLVPNELARVADVGTVGALDALDGEVPGFGRVSTDVPEGLTAVIGGPGRARRAVAELAIERGGGGYGSALRRLWSGRDLGGLEDTVRVAVEAVAESRGVAVVDAALARAGARTGAASLEPGVSPGTLVGGQGAVRDDPEQVAAEFRAAQRELQAFRADVVEVDGDLEAATMEWLRERQDAETNLLAYRDRARALRARLRSLEEAGPDAPCPTCGRELGRRYEEVIAELREEWEAIVQDGSWWRRRWEQLEMKPQHIQELEGRSLRLHAALEAGAERVELLRARLRELGRPEVADAGEDEPAGAVGRVVTALRRIRLARTERARDQLLDRASRFLCRISGGRILALTDSGGRLVLQGDRGPLTPVSEEDTATARVAVRLAAASLVAARGRVMASLIMEEPFDRLDVEARIRALVLMKQLRAEIGRFLIFSRGEAVDARPELFDAVFEIREDAVGVGPVLRPVPAGPGRVALRPTVRGGMGRAGGASASAPLP